jgi:hypothetical protein
MMKKRTSQKPLTGRVALVAGATRTSSLESITNEQIVDLNIQQKAVRIVQTNRHTASQVGGKRLACSGRDEDRFAQPVGKPAGTPYRYQFRFRNYNFRITGWVSVGFRAACALDADSAKCAARARPTRAGSSFSTTA